MRLSDFEYNLPKELIAQDPIKIRDESRLLVIDKKTGELSHHIFKDIINYINPGDTLVLNETKVIPARLIGNIVGASKIVGADIIRPYVGDDILSSRVGANANSVGDDILGRTLAEPTVEYAKYF